MSQLFKTTYCLACLVSWIKPGISQTTTNKGIEPQLILNVQLLNPAHARPKFVTEAEMEAARIYHAAGITIVWDECACSQVPSPTTVMLRLSPRFPGSVRQENLGYAPTGDEGGSLAIIFYDRVEAMTPGESPSRVLGYAIAHEIGHLLLGRNAHSSAGLMRGYWTRKDLKPSYRDQMNFTLGQAERMRTRIDSEMKQKESLQAHLAR